MYEHKCKKSGVAMIPLIVEGRHEACLAYMEAYKSEAGKEEFLFTNSNNNRDDAQLAITWMKNAILSQFLTEKELKTLTPKVWRHAWANWSEDSSDPEMAALASKVMRHSPEVRRVHYLEKNRQDATKFGKTIIENVLEGNETVGAKEKRPKEKGRKETEQRRVIDDEDRSLLRSVLFNGEVAPTSFGQNVMDEASKKNTQFKKLYKKILKSKNGNKIQTNMMIRKSANSGKKKEGKGRQE